MGRLCERPGCSQPAEVIYGMTAVDLTVWLEALGDGEPVRSGVLCRRHADAMVVPRGWTLDDRRDAVPRLFRTVDTSGVAPVPVPVDEVTPPAAVVEAAPLGVDEPRRVRRRGRRSADDTGQLDLTSLLDGESAPAPVPGVSEAPSDVPIDVPADAPVDDAPDPDPMPASPWRPVFDQGSDLDGLLDVRSPLLSRAFRGRTGPER